MTSRVSTTETPQPKQQHPLFIPLKTEFYEAFCEGSKTVEYRRAGAGWNSKTCRVGRAVTISKGYGKQHRRNGMIVGFCLSDLPCRTAAWRKCYGDDSGPAACITIEIYKT
jgi:hypothetical protein